MTIINCRRLVAIAFASLFVSFAQPAEARPLLSDPRLLTGTLDNGVKWVYRRHTNPPGKMAFMMHVRAGSLNETDAQRGLAHFMEHMVFNGTEHFKPGELISFCERMGMQFGSDLNASTSFDRTTFMLFTPKADLDQIDKALMILADAVFQVSLDEKEIDKERGVILEEARGRKNAEQRIRDKLWPDLYAGSRFANRLPIGDPDVVAKAPRSEFVDFYRTWYRPESITVIIVGDADPDPIVPLIRKWFGDYKSDRPAKQPPLAEVKPFRSQRAFVITDPEITTCRIQMMNLLPGRPAATTVEQWRTELVEGIANRIMGRRFDEKVKKGKAGFRSAGTSVSRFFNDESVMVGGSATGEPADWSKMLEQLILEISQAREYGFTAREMDLIRKEVAASTERSVRTESTRNARSIAQEIFNAIDEGVPVTSAQQDLDLVREVLPTITVSEVNAEFKSRFAPGPFAYVILMPEKDGVAVPSRDDVLATARAAWSRKVQPPEDEGAAKDLLASLPKPGRVVESEEDKDLGIASVWLDNGARVHHRFMDYKKDSVTVSISFAGGGIEETTENLGVTSLAALAFGNAATNRLGSTEIRDLMVGKNIKVSGGPSGDDAFVVEVGGSPKDLEAGLQLAYALITDGKIEETAFKNWRTIALRQIEQNQKSVSYKAGEALSDLLSAGDPRRLPVRKESIEALTIPQAQAWLQRLCRKGPVEVAVVGDMPWADVQPLIERYVGSLPARGRSAACLEPLRKLSHRPGPLIRRVEVETITPAAVTYAGFVGCEGRNADDRRALHLAATCLSSQLLKRVREDLSLVYVITADSTSAWIYRNAGRFSAGAKCKPENADRVAEEIHKAFREFAEAGPPADELESARKQVLNKLDTGMKEPAFWLDLLAHLDLRGHNLDDARQEKAKYEAVTIEQVRAAFRKYYTPEQSFTVTGIPVAPKPQPQTRPAPEKEPASANH